MHRSPDFDMSSNGRIGSRDKIQVVVSASPVLSWGKKDPMSKVLTAKISFLDPPSTFVWMAAFGPLP